MIKTENIAYSINNKMILKDINISLNYGEITSLIGPNGAGKSTLLKCLTGLLKPSQGKILLDGKAFETYNLKKLSLKRAVLSQSNFITFPFSSFDIVMMGREPYIDLAGEIKNEDIVYHCLKLVEASHLKNRIFFTLSGGEQQRIHIARVLAQIIEQKKAFLFLDEPISALDLKYQHKILDLMNKLSLKNSLAICLIIHNLKLAKYYSQKAILIKEGKIFALGKTAKVLSKENISNVFEIPQKFVF